MKRTEANLNGVKSKLARLGGLDKFPRTPEGLDGIADAVLDIVGDQPACWTEEYDPEQGKAIPTLIRAAMAAEETLDWLVGRVMAGCETFPPPIVMRRLYDEKFDTSDGRTPAEVEVK